MSPNQVTLRPHNFSLDRLHQSQSSELGNKRGEAAEEEGKKRVLTMLKQINGFLRLINMSQLFVCYFAVHVSVHGTGDVKRFIEVSVTGYWGKNVAQMFPKVAQIDATVVFTLNYAFQNRPNVFGLLL